MLLDLHTEVMCWLRYTKRFPIVCTEAGPWNADVIGASDHMVTEVEIKKSKADFLRDFKDKKAKHWHYDNASEADNDVPNYYYFATPESLEEEALKIIEEKMPRAGLIVQLETELLAGQNVMVIKKPTRLRKGKPSHEMTQKLLARMSSDLCRSKQLIYRLKKEFNEKSKEQT